MKFQTYTIGIVVLVCTLFAFTSCHDNNNSSNGQTRALSEQNFVDDTSLRADPVENIIALFIEPPDAAEEDNLTGGLGFDVIPYTYTRTLNHTFCFTDANPDSEHFAILQDSDGMEIIRAEANRDCVTVLLEPGDYEIVLTHGEHIEGIEPVFLVPMLEGEQLTREDRSTPSVFSKFFESISNVFTRPALAQSTSDNVTTLISTNACVDCDLMGVDLTGNDLSFSDLTGADLSEANLIAVEFFEATLNNANLSGASLSGADFQDAEMIGVNLSGADMSDTNGRVSLRGADMTGADLSNSDLTRAFFSSTILTNADLTGAIITDAEFDNTNLVGATWIDGSTCDITSIGMCNSSGGGDSNPCDSVSIGTTHDFNVVYKCLLPTVPGEDCTTETDPELDEDVTTCVPKDPDDLVISVDLVDIFDQVSSSLGGNLDSNTPMAILAWGGEGGIGANDLFTTGGGGGEGGFASTATTLSDFLSDYGQTSFYFYIAEAGTLSNVDGDGASSTLVMLVESNPSSTDDVLLIAGGGAGGDSAGILTDGSTGARGGHAAASVIGQGFIGVGQGVVSGADGGSTDGTGVGGNGTNDGKDGIGGQGGQGFLGLNSEWINGDPDVGSDGRGGNADDGFSSDGGGGGGGGLGGGGAGDGEPGAGGGSFSMPATITCDSAPNNDAVPSSPGKSRDSLGSKNGAVEVWIFVNGCSVQ